MKKIKKILLVLFALFGLLLNSIPVHAASLSVSGTASTTSTVVGNTITITFKYSSEKPLGAVVYSMSYDSDYLTLTSGTQTNALSYTGSQKSDSIKFTFKAKAKGNTTVTFKINEALDFDGNTLSAGTTSKTITIKSQADVEASYSKNNNLSSLSISDGELSPKFDKNTLEYSATVENEVGQITVSGNKEDSKSYVDGLKTYELEEGSNKIEVKVTAQNGNSKTYVINVTRKELAPINVKTEEGLDLAVVRKKDLLKSPNANYEETTIKIGEEEVPGFYNKATDTYLVGLKDEDGNIKLYNYKDEKYSLYKEFTFNSIIITATSKGSIPEGFVEETIKIGEEDVVAYKDEENNNDYYLINGKNISTGEEHLYQYDKKENTLQIFNEDLLTKIDVLNDKNNNYLYVIIGLGSLLIITYIVILLSSIKNNKKKIKKLDEDIEEEKEKIEKANEENENEIEENEKVEEIVEKKEKRRRRKHDFDFGDDTVSILDVEAPKEEPIEEEVNESNETIEEEKVEEPIEEKEKEEDIDEDKERTEIFEKRIEETQDIESEIDKIEEVLQKKTTKKRKKRKPIEK